MRILHSEWSDGWGGQERRILLECEGLAARGHEVGIVTRETCWIAGQARRHTIPVSCIDMRRKFDPRAVWRLARHLRAGRFDVLHTHSGIDSWIGGMAAKLAGTPVLVRTRHLHIPFRRSPLNFVHYLPDRILCIGDTMRKTLVEERGFPPEQIVNVPTGIDFERFAPKRPRAEVRAGLDTAEGCFAVLIVGVIRGVKRHDIAIEGFARLLATGADAVLWVAGDGPMRPDMERLARTLGVAERVRFLGQRDDVPDLMGAADALLLTSRSEAQSQALTQGLGLGLPAVATAVGGVPEVVIHERTGLLVPANEAQPVADALLRLLRDPALARRLGDAGREHARGRYSLERMLDDTERIYAEVLAAKRGGRR